MKGQGDLGFDLSFKHGTKAGYEGHGCRCTNCVTWKSVKNRRRQKPSGSRGAHSEGSSGAHGAPGAHPSDLLKHRESAQEPPAAAPEPPGEPPTVPDATLEAAVITALSELVADPGSRITVDLPAGATGHEAAELADRFESAGQLDGLPGVLAGKVTERGLTIWCDPGGPEPEPEPEPEPATTRSRYFGVAPAIPLTALLKPAASQPLAPLGSAVLGAVTRTPVRRYESIPSSPPRLAITAGPAVQPSDEYISMPDPAGYQTATRPAPVRHPQPDGNYRGPRLVPAARAGTVPVRGAEVLRPTREAPAPVSRGVAEPDLGYG